MPFTPTLGRQEQADLSLRPDCSTQRVPGQKLCLEKPYIHTYIQRDRQKQEPVEMREACRLQAQ